MDSKHRSGFFEHRVKSLFGDPGWFPRHLAPLAVARSDWFYFTLPAEFHPSKTPAPNFRGSSPRLTPKPLPTHLSAYSL